jgi:signal transduction histidine kinase
MARSRAPWSAGAPTAHAPAPLAALDTELRGRVYFGLWIALVATALFAVGDAIFASDVLWLLYPLKAFYLLTVALAFRALATAADAEAITRVALLAVAVSFVVSATSSAIGRDPLTTPVLCSAVTLAGAALVPWTVGAQCVVVGLATVALIANGILLGGGASLRAYPAIVVIACMGLSIYVSHILGRYRALAAAAEQRLRADAQIAAALARVGRELIAALDTDAVLDRLAQLTVETFGCSASQTWMRDVDGSFHVAAGISDDAEELAALHALHIPERAVAPLIERLRREGPVILTPEEIAAMPTETLSRRHAVGHVIFIPLRRGADVVGVQTVVFRGSAEPLDLAAPALADGIAQLAALALETSRLVDAMQAADRLKTEFLANLSHELRTPLNVIIGYNEMLLDGGCGPLTDEQQSVLGRAQHNARELLALMGAALELSRHEGRGVPLVLEPVSVALLADTLAREVAALPPLPGVAFEWAVPEDLPPLLTDALKLRMILKNLIDNARKYTEHGRISLTARAAGEGIEFAVRDTGYGIPADDLSRIFEPFRQITGGRPPNGVGLGLFLVRRLTEALGGRVDVESTLGAGSTFRVWLPLRATPR